MNKNIQLIFEKFVSDQPLSNSELREIKSYFQVNNKDQINRWLANNWELASYDDIEVSYEGLKLKIREYENRRTIGRNFYSKVRHLAHYYQRAAAILLIPVILGISYFAFFSQQHTESYYTCEAPLGQKAKLELPDGSLVWLNSGSSVRYSSDFNKQERDIELTGEAFFEVAKNTGKPFVVSTRYLDVRVTGTKFNVNVYDDEPTVETALIEGSVNLRIKDGDRVFQLKPGKVLSYSKQSGNAQTLDLQEEPTISWKENRLIFINDDFPKLVRKIEKWFNVRVIYDQERFKNNKLTVRLLEGEQLSQLLDIIETALDANCTVEKNKITINKNS